jgi:hypothetical protein
MDEQRVAGSIGTGYTTKGTTMLRMFRQSMPRLAAMITDVEVVRPPFSHASDS